MFLSIYTNSQVIKEELRGQIIWYNWKIIREVHIEK